MHQKEKEHRPKLEHDTQFMLLKIKRSYNAKIFTEYKSHDRNYVLLFFKDGTAGPFYVTDSALILKGTLFSLGDIHRLGPNGPVVGRIFYTHSYLICEGSFALAHSNRVKDNINRRGVSAPLDLNMELILKTPHFYAYSRTNDATLLVNPSLHKSIRANLEI